MDSDRRAEHLPRTEAIVRMQTDLNARVYPLFDLMPVDDHPSAGYNIPTLTIILPIVQVINGELSNRLRC